MTKLWTIDGVLQQLAILEESRRAGSISSIRAEMLERALKHQLRLLERVAQKRKRITRLLRRTT
jgi:hypothetical protein